MPKTLITPQTASRAGVKAVPVTLDATNGNYVAPFTGLELFLFANASGTTDYTVTFTAQSADPRGNKTNLVVTVSHTNNGTMAAALIVGPFQYADWYDSSQAGLDVTAQATASTNLTAIVVTNPVNNPAATTGG